ncbi:MAG: molybdopterin molybdotransferase MoeA [Armatimonadota bacterium]
MISFDEAIQCVRENKWHGQAVSVPLAKGVGRRLAESIEAKFDSPAFSNSAMDGYALGSLEGPWRIVGVLAAGSTVERVAVGEAYRIFTGAAIPDRTIAVVAQEDCNVDSNVLSCPSKLKAGSHIRRRAEEFSCGTILFENGEIVTPPMLSALASQGLEYVTVMSAPKVALISTGSELLRPGDELIEGMIYESNSIALECLLTALGCEVSTATVPDDEAVTTELLRSMAVENDLLVTIGGVSVGDRDFVRPCMEACDFNLKFWKVAMKPGKPVAFATRHDGKSWLGLPGNPMSALTTFCLFGMAFLGQELEFRPMTLAHDFERKPGREEFVPATLSPNLAPQLTIHSTIGSHSTSGLSQASGLVRIPMDTEKLAANQVILYADLPWRTS